MSSSFHNADKPTHRRTMLVGLLFCAAFIAVCFFAKPQPENDYVLVKADKLVRRAGKPRPANLIAASMCQLRFNGATWVAGTTWVVGIMFTT